MRALESQFFSIYLNLLTFTFDKSRRVNPQWDIMFSNGVKFLFFTSAKNVQPELGSLT